MNSNKKITIPPEVIEACRQGEQVIPLRRQIKGDQPPYPDELPLRRLTMDELEAWQEKYNASGWMVVNRAGLRYHIEDEAIWDDLCKSTGQKEGCTQFRVPALPDHGFPFPLTALGPFRLRETLDDRKSSRKDRPTRGNPNRVIVACRDSASKIQKLARKLNVDLDSFLVLSRKDNPELQTFDDIVAALPPGIELLLLDDVEYLFPPGQRDPDSVRDFLERMKARYGHLGFNLMATVSGTDPVLTMSMIQSMGCKEENDEQSSHSSK